MKIRDGRKLKLSQKELVRKQAVYFVLNQGMTREKTALLLGVSGYSVRKWVKNYNLNGERSLNNKCYLFPFHQENEFLHFSV